VHDWDYTKGGAGFKIGMLTNIKRIHQKFGVAHWTRAVVSALGGVIDDKAIHPE